MKWLAVLVLPALLLAGCRKEDLDDPGAGGTGSEIEAMAFLQAFTRSDIDRHALSQKLQPRPGDFDAVFEPEAVAKARSGYATAWGTHKLTIGDGPNLPEVTVVHATSDDLRADNEASHALPRGYARVAKVLKPGVTIYAFKFTRPGEKTGSEYDGLIFVNGHWAYFPKPFHVLR